MPLNTHKILFAIVMILFVACKKEKIFKDDDKFVAQKEELSLLQAAVSSAGQQFIELQWSKVNNTHFKQVSYSIYLNNDKVVQGLTNTKYSLINLTPGKSYEIKIVAATADGKSVEQKLTAKTLDLVTSNVLYKEYSIHSYSMMTGSTNLQQSANGDHVVVRFLSHPAYFGGEAMKIIVFKLDKNGTMLWYRLLSTKDYRGTTLSQIPLTWHNGDKEIVLLIGGFATKLNAVTGEVMLVKDFSDRVGDQYFQSLLHTSDQQIIAGTNFGSLCAINPTDLSISWYHVNATKPGAIVAIKQDSKKNIYYIFQDRNDSHPQIRIHKCNANGEFLTSFLLDGTLPNEYNWGFLMNALLVDAQDNFYLFGHNSDYNFLRYFKFSTEGVVLKKNTVSDNLIARYAFIDHKGDIIVAGRIDGSTFNTYGAIYIFDKDLNIKSKQVYNTLPYHIIQGVSGNADGSYNIFLNYMQTYTYENFNFVFIKTGPDGKI